MNAGNAFQSLYDIVIRLRGPEGCPWDREQTPESLRGDLIEETYECIEAIDEKESSHIKEELGDIFLLITMLSYMHEQEGVFRLSEVLDSICEKLVRRHPHVFGELKIDNSAEVLDNWARIKVEQEGRKPKDSVLDGVSSGLPPLDRAWKLQKKASQAGFDWPDIEGVISKITEELEEVREAANNAHNARPATGKSAPAAGPVTANAEPAADKAAVGEASEKLEEEIGDLLFSAVNLCRYLGVEPSLALRRTNSKFTGRFKYVEQKMKESGLELKNENLEAMDKFWNEAKNHSPP